MKLEFKTGFAGCIGKSLDFAMIEVTAAVEAAEHLLTDARTRREDVTVTVGDRQVTIPAPDSAVARTDTGLFSGPASLELTWSPKESE